MMRRVPAIVVGVALWSAGPAQAHLVSTELGPFYDGAAHSLVSPLDLMTILGLAILASFGGVATGRRLVLALAMAWSVGLVAGFVVLDRPWDVPVASSGLTLLLGIAAALRFRVSPVALVPAAAVTGVLRGIMNGSAARAADGTWLSVTGIAVGVLVLAILASGLGAWLVRRRFEIAMRVAGSWVAAISLLVIGWSFRT